MPGRIWSKDRKFDEYASRLGTMARVGDHLRETHGDNWDGVVTEIKRGKTGGTVWVLADMERTGAIKRKSVDLSYAEIGLLDRWGPDWMEKWAQHNAEKEAR